MNTFLPFKSFTRSAKVLDSKRLGKQRVEVFQILRVLRGETIGWRNHPAVKMWRGHEQALGMYGAAMCDEWTNHGYVDATKTKILTLSGYTPGTTAIAPWWLGAPDFHLAQQSNLLRKKRDHYEQFFPFVPDDLPYWWPDEETWKQDPRLLTIRKRMIELGLSEIDGDFIQMTGHPASR